MEEAEDEETLQPDPRQLDEYGYPLDWPKCPGCGRPTLDCRETCGRVHCSTWWRKQY